MAILQCNKCANLFHDDAPHECDVERWQRLAREGQQYFGRAIGNAPKPVIEPIPPGPYVAPRFDPKPATPEPMGKEIVVAEFEDQRYTRFEPATPEPPEWKGWAMPDILREQLAQPSTVVHEPSPLDRALEDFTARRKAATMPMTFEEAGHVWGFNTDACVNCGYTAQALVATQHLPLCADQRGINAQAKVFSRAMSTPLPHDPPMSARLMPWRGKE